MADQMDSDPTHVCFYHFPCNDGIASAWVLARSLPEAELIGVKPGCKEVNPEHYNNRELYFVDVCPNLELLTRLLDLKNKVVILDHHISNQRMLESMKTSEGGNLHIVFDMERSGCQITWDYFNPDPDEEEAYLLRPWFIDYIGDRDLWKFEMEDSRIVNLALSEFGYVSLENLSTLPDSGYSQDYEFIHENLLIPGTVIDQKHSRMMKRDLKKALKAELSFNQVVDGVEQHFSYTVWIGSTYGYLTSDFGHLMYKTPFPKENEDDPDVYPDFAVVWSYRLDTDSWKYSLRSGKRGEMSADDAVDVSQVCAYFGGGGHKAASGFEILEKDGGHPRHVFTFD